MAKKQHKYFDNVLIKLKRAYRKDEVVAALATGLKEANKAIEDLTKQRDQAYQKIERVLQVDNKTKARLHNQRQYAKYRAEIKALKNKNRTLRGDNEVLLTKLAMANEKLLKYEATD